MHFGGERADSAHAALFLAGPASSWITGGGLPVDGGAHVRWGPMIELHLATTLRLALHTNAVANLADGAFLQGRRAGPHRRPATRAVTIARDQLAPVTGRPPDGAVRAALAAPPASGRQLSAGAARLRLDTG